MMGYNTAQVKTSKYPCYILRIFCLQSGGVLPTQATNMLNLLAMRRMISCSFANWIPIVTNAILYTTRGCGKVQSTLRWRQGLNVLLPYFQCRGGFVPHYPNLQVTRSLVCTV